MATEVVLKTWNRVQLEWEGATYEENVVEHDYLCLDTKMWLTTEQEKFLKGKEVGSKIELETPKYPQGFFGTSIYTKISLVFEHDHEAFEFMIKYL